MSLMNFFKSKSTQELEARIRFRRSKGRVQKYVQESKQASDRYWRLACDAYRLGDSEQFKMIGAHYLRLQQSIMRWQRFLVKLEALELRRNEVGASREFLEGLGELTSAINQGASAKEILRMQGEIEKAIEKSKSQEEMLDMAMDAAGAGFDGEFLDGEKSMTELARSIEHSLGASLKDTLDGPAKNRTNDPQFLQQVHNAINQLNL